MKKNTLLLLSLFSAWSMNVSAQTDQVRAKIRSTYEKSDVKEVESLRKELALARESAHRIAKENNKEISGVTADGRVYSLQRIDEKGSYIYYITSNAGSRTTARVNDIAPKGSLGLNLDGKDITVGVWDGEPALDTHVEFKDAQSGKSRMELRDAVLDLATAPDWRLEDFEEGRMHATHVSGTIGAGGAVANAKGIAPNSRILSYDWTDDVAEMKEAADKDALLVSNHSYGLAAMTPDGRPILPVEYFGAYMRESREYDKITYQYKYYQPVVAAGNDRRYYNIINPTKKGNDLLTSTAVSKNVIVVAAVGQVTTYAGPFSVTMSAFSNYGPTKDFRIKPDISAKGVNVYSSIYSMPVVVTGQPSNNSYATESGTSMAAPAVAGVIALWQQWAMENKKMALKSATIRGLMTHTADEAGSAPGPDHQFGWGLINAKAGVRVLLGAQDGDVILEESELVQGGTYEKEFTIKEGGVKFLATLAWTDPEGAFSWNNFEEKYAKSNPSLVNDLDLRVFKDGVEFFPWRLNKDYDNLVALKGDNDVDNIEKIEIDAAEAGVYTIKVTHKGVLQDGKQEFSLLVSHGNFDKLSIDDFETKDIQFSIWPNPVVENLNITIPSEVELSQVTVQLFDMSGRMVQNLKTITTNQLEVDMKGLSSGIYMLKIKGKGFDKTERIVKK